MKIRFGLSHGCLPYVQTLSPDGWGHARGPWVRIPADSWQDEVLRRHEEWHVAQFYALAGVAVFLGAGARFGLHQLGAEGPAFLIYLAAGLLVAMLTRLDWVKRRMEAAAYGESLRAADLSGLGLAATARNYASILANAKTYALYDPNVDEALRLIRKRHQDGRLF